jgi:hypothetical protein
MTVDTLVTKYKKSEKWVRMQLDAYKLPAWKPAPRPMVAIMDATHTGDSWMLVVRDPNAKENVYCREHMHETTFAYQEAKRTLEEKGFVFMAIVGDGRVATSWLFSDVPVQMCHFHQLQIIIKYTTLDPKLEAGKELLDLVRTLPNTDKDSFTDAFMLWCRTWESFLLEQTVDADTGRKNYTHRNLRAARTSIKQHLPYLFTYQKYPEHNIPNTTNSLDGSFGKVKKSIGIHSGLKRLRKLKMITSLIIGNV